MRVSHRLITQILCMISLLFAQVYCLAQIDRAGLNGTVRDTAGKLVPGARIVAIQAATGLHRETVSSPSGTYDIPELPIGTYRVTCARHCPKNWLWFRGCLPFSIIYRIAIGIFPEILCKLFILLNYSRKCPNMWTRGGGGVEGVNGVGNIIFRLTVVGRMLPF